jgi:hypothetical protein
MYMKRLASCGAHCPWHPWPMLPARPTAPVLTTAVGSTRGDPGGPVDEGRGNPAATPGSVWGAAESGWNRCQGATSLVLLASARGHTGSCRRMRRRVGRREARAQRNADAAGRGGWGVGGGARASRAHGASAPWRRPRACGKTRPEGPSDRASGPRGRPGGAGAMGRNASCAPGEEPQVLSRIPCKWSVRFVTGGMRRRTATQRALCLPNVNLDPDKSCLICQ